MRAFTLIILNTVIPEDTVGAEEKESPRGQFSSLFPLNIARWLILSSSTASMIFVTLPLFLLVFNVAS